MAQKKYSLYRKVTSESRMLYSSYLKFYPVDKVCYLCNYIISVSMCTTWYLQNCFLFIVSVLIS
jgi:hypothetical protein